MDRPVEGPLHPRVLRGLDERVRQLGHVRVAVRGGQRDERASLLRGASAAHCATWESLMRSVSGSPTETGTGRPDRTVSCHRRSVKRSQKARCARCTPTGQPSTSWPELLLGQGVDEALQSHSGGVIAGDVAAVHGAPRMVLRMPGGALRGYQRPVSGLLQVQLPECLVELAGPCAGAAHGSLGRERDVICISADGRPADDAVRSIQVKVGAGGRCPPRSATAGS